MTAALMKSTQVAVILSLDVITRTDTRARTITPLWVNLTPVLLWLLGVGELIVSLVYLFQAVNMVLSVYVTWGEIIARSLAWGIGVRV